MQGATTQLTLFPDDDEFDSLSGFSVRESGKAKRLSIKVFPRGRVEVVVPKRTRAADVREFVESHRDWIQKSREQFASEHTPEPFVLPRKIRLDGIGRQRLVAGAGLGDGVRSAFQHGRFATECDFACACCLRVAVGCSGYGVCEQCGSWACMVTDAADFCG